MSFAIGQIKKLNLVDTKLTNCTYSETATQYGNLGSVQFEAIEHSESLKCDVNHDGRINISDVVAIISTIAGDNKYKNSADANGDTSINISDVVSVINIIAKQ